MNLYVGNLSRETVEADLRQTFEAFGQVTKAKVIMDRDTNRSKGFGFVEMANQTEGEAAISGLKGKELQGRTLNVSEARRLSESPRTDRQPDNGYRRG